MSFIRNQIFYYYFFAILVVVMIVVAHFKLREYSYRDKELVSALMLLQDSAKLSTTVFDINLIDNLEPQLECASDKNMNWMQHFKKDSLSYAKNIISYTFNSLLKLDVRLIRMESTKKTMRCDLLVKDKNQFKVIIVFVKKGDKYLLYNIENLCPLYERLKCHTLVSERQTSLTQNTHGK